MTAESTARLCIELREQAFWLVKRQLPPPVEDHKVLRQVFFGVGRASCCLTVWGANAVHCAAVFITEHLENAVVGCAKGDVGLPCRVTPVVEQFVKREDFRDMSDGPL